MTVASIPRMTANASVAASQSDGRAFAVVLGRYVGNVGLEEDLVNIRVLDVNE
jgi:hypothetical protein